MSVLSGVNILEFAGIGPGPFCGMLLADLGANVIVIERAGADDGLMNRGKRSICLDLKQAEDVEIAKALLVWADASIEGFRPGVLERLGLGPVDALQWNPRLVYGRMTGWGQDGPLASTAGHDANYLSLTGTLWYSGEPGSAPTAPATVMGDIGGGALYLAVGLLAGIMQARTNGKGQVVDAAIIDGAAHSLNLLLAITGGVYRRGGSLADGPHWAATYRCADGGYINISSLEPKFYAIMLDKLGLSDDPAFKDQYDVASWPALRERMASIFLKRDRDAWAELFAGSDACVTPVLSPQEAASHPHLKARGVFHDTGGGRLQAAPAPRFSETGSIAPGNTPKPDGNRAEILTLLRKAGHLGPNSAGS